MPKYRKKPAVIEAEQWFPGVRIAGVYENRIIGEVDVVYGRTETTNGSIIVVAGDWIIVDAAGERSVCSDDVFVRTYERIEDDDDDEGE